MMKHDDGADIKKTIKKKKRSSRRKSISSPAILGKLPFSGFLMVLGGLAFFLGLNAYLAIFFLNDPNNSSSSSSFLAFSWATPLLERLELIRSSSCQPFGCVVYPPEFDQEQVLEAISSLVQAANNPDDNIQTAIPYASWTGATLTRTSNRKDPPFNQDAAIRIQPFVTAQTTSEQDFLIGIFDGHGAWGHQNAKYFAEDIPARLAYKFNQVKPPKDVVDSAWIIQALKDTFVESDALAPKDIILRGGCTASVTLRRDNQLFFANTGDSRTLLVSVDASEFQIVEQGPAPGVIQHYITRSDKPHLPQELDRIHAAGGNVHIPPPPKNPMLSRVVVYSHTFNDTIGLAMSRSLGDYEWTVKGVIPDPLVDVLDLKRNETLANILEDPASSLFVIAASDGLWDLRLKQWFAKQFAESFLPPSDPRRIHPLSKMHDIIVQASPKNDLGYRDDITAITMKVS